MGHCPKMVKKALKGQAKALVRLPVCAGWSEPLLVTQTTLSGNLMPRLISIYSYWDSSFDDELLENKVAMNLLYVQVRNSLISLFMGAQWLSGRVLDSRPRGRRFEPHRRHCVVVLEQTDLS